MNTSERPSISGSWRLSATMLGLLTWIAAGVTMSVLALPGAWSFVTFAGVSLLMLAVGTWLLVPRR